MTREDEIFKKLKQGDGHAPEELVKLYYPEILRYCLWQASDRMAAEDAAVSYTHLFMNLPAIMYWIRLFCRITMENI